MDFPKSFNENFSENLKKIRKEKGLSQKEVARRLGVSQPSYAQYERGVRSPKVETIERIADALEVPLTELLGDKNNRIFKYFKMTRLNEQIDKNTLLNSTISIHFDGDEFTKEELEDIIAYAEFVKSRRKTD